MANPAEPEIKRAVAFYDGQNLYRHAKDAFGHHHPNFDPKKLFDAVCAACGYRNNGVRLYTGVPTADRDPFWHGYWNNRLLVMRRAGISVTTRPIRYRDVDVEMQDGSIKTVTSTHEKGIDVRLALDVVRLARGNQLDIVVIFSQDQDLAEVAEDIREIARTQESWIKVVCAFPSGPNATAKRGIDKTDWFPMDQAFYDACLDPRDYRPKNIQR